MKRLLLAVLTILLFTWTSWAQNAPTNPPAEAKPSKAHAKHHAHPAERHKAHAAERHQSRSATHHHAHAATKHKQPKAKKHTGA